MIRFFSITLLISLMFTGADGCAQKKHTILFKIDGQPQLVSGFLNNYNKNSDIVADTTQKKC